MDLRAGSSERRFGAQACSVPRLRRWGDQTAGKAEQGGTGSGHCAPVLFEAATRDRLLLAALSRGSQCFGSNRPWRQLPNNNFQEWDIMNDKPIKIPGSDHLMP